MRRFRSRPGESISAVHVSDYTIQDPIMIRKRRAARNQIVIITIRISIASKY